MPSTTDHRLSFPARPGPRPLTTTRIPHAQLDQQPADDRVLDRLLSEGAAWPRVRRALSGISVEGAEALVLDGVAGGPADAFLIGGEFAHGHGGGDCSLHAALPLDVAAAAERAGWAEPHFLVRQGVLPANIMMLYAPRDDAEARVLLELVRRSYEHAITSHGADAVTTTRSAP